jgi:hypothetical protein
MEAAMFNGSINGNQFECALPRDGDYRVQGCRDRWLFEESLLRAIDRAIGKPSETLWNISIRMATIPSMCSRSLSDRGYGR